MIVICALVTLVSYPAVGRLVHVPFYFTSVSHKVFHPPVFQCSWVRSGKDGLHTTHTQIQRRVNIYTQSSKKWIQRNASAFFLSFVSQDGSQQTHSLWTRWLRRSCVMSSCQDFLIPAAEGGAAAGREPRFPTPSFIKLQESTTEEVHVSSNTGWILTFKTVSLVCVLHLCAVMLLCMMASGRRADCWLGGCTSTPPFTPIGFPPKKRWKPSIVSEPEAL